MADRKYWARIWQTVSKISRREIFGTDDSDTFPEVCQTDARIMTPGYIGRRYKVGGTALVGINPAGGTSAYERHPKDAELYSVSKALRDAANPKELVETFETLTTVYIDAIQDWPMWRIINPCLDAIQCNLDDIAFLNIVPYRTKDNKAPGKSAVSRSHTMVFQPQVSAIRPSQILALGKKAGEILREISLSGVEVVSVRRTHGDRYIHPEAEETLRGLAARFGGTCLDRTNVRNAKRLPTKTVNKRRNGNAQGEQKIITQSKAAQRAEEIARQLGIVVRTGGALGQYLKSSTGTEQVDVVVFSRHGLDCVGFEGRGKKMQYLNENEEKWRKAGFLRHQKSPESHKSAVTFIQEFEPLENGAIDPHIRKAYKSIRSIFG